MAAADGGFFGLVGAAISPDHLLGGKGRNHHAGAVLESPAKDL